MENSFYTIGDVHGCYKTLMALLDQLPIKDEKVIFVGDLIDRGPMSYEVFTLIRKTSNFLTVRGNHEQMMLFALESFDTIDGRLDLELWVNNGGISTINSFKANNILDLAYMIPELQALPLFIEIGEYIISHSSVYQSYPDVTEEEVLWSRHPKIKPLKNGKYNIFGHTPRRKKPTILKHYANIDTGCVYNESGLGMLTALKVPEMKVYQQKRID